MNITLSWWRDQKRVAVTVLLLAAFLTVAYKLGDAYVVTHLVTASDGIVATLTYLVLGATVGLTINFLLCQTPAGKLVDSSFTSIKSIPAGPMRLAVVTGVLGALSTGIYLWAFRSLDPSLVVPLSSLMVVYVAVAETMKGRVKFGHVWPSLVLVLLGIAVASLNSHTSWEVTVGTFVLLVVVHNGINAAGELLSKDAVDESDAVAFGFWRFFWLTASAYVLSALVVVLTGKVSVLLTSLWSNLPAVPFIGLVMVVVFFALGWANKGLAMSDATTKNLVMSLPTVMTVLATAAVNTLFPGTFILAPATVFEWFLRFVGTALILWGVIRLPRKE